MRHAQSKPTADSPKIAAPVKGSSRFPAALVAAVLGAVTLALYWPATSHDFVNYDDDVYVTENVQVQGGLSWENLKRAFVNPVNCNWHPVTVLSYMMDHQLSGLNPWGYHLTNVLLHAVNTALVFWWLWRLTGAGWRSALVAAVFGWHPLHVESVAWIAERKDVLSGWFGLLTLIFYVRYARTDKVGVGNGPLRWHQGRTLNYVLTLFFLALGLMSKPMLVTWPLVMLLLDYWPLERVAGFKFQVSGWWPMVKEKLPFFGLVAGMSVVTFMVQKVGGAMEMGQRLSLGARGENALISYGLYWGKLFWPTKLAVFYPHPGHWPGWAVLLAGGFLAGVSAFLFRQRQRRPYLLMGWLWFVGTLVPVIGLVQVGEQAMADRYMYLPAVGALIMVVWGGHELTRSWRQQAVMLWVASSAIILVCGGLTWRQLGYWQDGETLWRHTLAVTKNNYLAHNNLGCTLINQGHTEEAMVQIQEALRIKPDNVLAHVNLSEALLKQERFSEAIQHCEQALQLKPDRRDAALAHNNLGYALSRLGNGDEAINHYEQALRLDADLAITHINLGIALAVHQKRWGEAIEQFQQATRITPENADAWNNIGQAFVDQGNPDKALPYFQQAERLAAAQNRTNLLGTIRGNLAPYSSQSSPP